MREIGKSLRLSNSFCSVPLFWCLLLTFLHLHFGVVSGLQDLQTLSQ